MEQDNQTISDFNNYRNQEIDFDDYEETSEDDSELESDMRLDQ